MITRHTSQPAFQIHSPYHLFQYTHQERFPHLQPQMQSSNSRGTRLCAVSQSARLSRGTGRERVPVGNGGARVTLSCGTVCAHPHTRNREQAELRAVCTRLIITVLTVYSGSCCRLCASPE